MKRTSWLLAAVSTLAIDGTASAQSAPPPTASATPVTDPQEAGQENSDGAPANGLQGNAGAEATGNDVIVTASRRETTLRETPTAVSAYGGEQLREAQIISLRDLAATTPNVQFGGFANNANVSIRGIGNTQLTLGSDPGVAFHVDGVYLGQTTLAGANFLDISRVEILRGPQGTLFGRNATGGAVNLIPNLPTKDFKAGVDLSVDVDPFGVRGSGYVSGPLTGDGKLLGRVAVLRNYNKGFTRNLNPDGPRQLDNLDTFGVRGQLQWFASDSANFRASIEHQQADDNGPAIFNVGVTAVSGQQPAILQGQDFGSVRRRRIFQNVGARKIDATTALATGDFDLGGSNLRLLYSYNRTKQFFQYEDDGTIIDFSRATADQRSHQHFAEALYTSDPSRPFTFVVGANHFHETLDQAISVFVSFLPITVDLGGKLKTNAYAAFGQAQYDLTPELKLFGGLRYTQDRKSIDEYNAFIGTGSQRESWSRFTYEAGLSYDLAPTVTAYAKYATGFKSGGFSGGSLAAPFDPETNGNLEAGLKGTYLGGALTANLAAFHMKYDRLQVQQIIGVVSAITNAAKATINGVEAELVIRPTGAFRIEASGAVLDATFDDFSTSDSARPSLGVLQLAGNRLPQSAKYTASVGAYLDVPAETGTVTPSARFDWKSRVFFTEFNLPVPSQGAVGKFDLRLTYKSGDERFNASAYILNVTNENIRANVLVTADLLGSTGLAFYNPGSSDRHLGRVQFLTLAHLPRRPWIC